MRSAVATEEGSDRITGERRTPVAHEHEELAVEFSHGDLGRPAVALDDAVAAGRTVVRPIDPETGVGDASAKLLRRAWATLTEPVGDRTGDEDRHDQRRREQSRGPPLHP